MQTILPVIATNHFIKWNTVAKRYWFKWQLRYIRTFTLKITPQLLSFSKWSGKTCISVQSVSMMFTSDVNIKRLKGIIGYHQFLNKASLCMRHVAICQLLVKWSSLWTQILASTGGEVKWQHVRLQIPHMVVLCRTLRRP